MDPNNPPSLDADRLLAHTRGPRFCMFVPNDLSIALLSFLFGNQFHQQYTDNHFPCHPFLVSSRQSSIPRGEMSKKQKLDHDTKKSAFSRLLHKIKQTQKVLQVSKKNN